MKKILAILIVAITLFSCKEKLPSNLKAAIDEVNNAEAKYESFEKPYASLTDSQLVARAISEAKITDVTILNNNVLLQEVAMNKLVAEEKMLLDHYNKVNDNFNDILRFNLRFIDFQEVKGVKELSTKPRLLVEGQLL